MKAWAFQAMQTLRNGGTVHGVVLAELVDDGLIFLEQHTETWLPTPEANDDFKNMLAEMQSGKASYPAG